MLYFMLLYLMQMGVFQVVAHANDDEMDRGLAARFGVKWTFIDTQTSSDPVSYTGASSTPHASFCLV